MNRDEILEPFATGKTPLAFKPEQEASLERPTAWQIGWRAARANLIPGIVLQIVAVAFVVAYSQSATFQEGLQGFAALQIRYGVFFTALTRAVCNGIVPALFCWLIPGLRVRRPWAALLFGMGWWAYIGVCTHLFYALQAFVWGADATLPTVLCKTTTDMLIYSPFFASPSVALAHLWQEQNYSLRATRRQLGRGWYSRIVLPNQIPGWTFWCPCLLALYSLPTALQMPMSALLGCFWALMCLQIANRTPAQSSSHLGPELAVHGASWGEVHGGYFSNPEVARPLVEAVQCARKHSRPERMIDLGGGTGFLLSCLPEVGLESGRDLIVLDESEPQLAVAAQRGFTCVRGSVAAFHRADVVAPRQRVLWLMRSVLHYAGRDGLRPMLTHLRAQAQAGEMWVHQTACFERPEDAACLTALYAHMHTEKFYPTLPELREHLAKTGWEVTSVQPAPPLLLDSAELVSRYDLTPSDLAALRRDMCRDFGATTPVFRCGPESFQTELHYSIFTCRAI